MGKKVKKLIEKTYYKCPLCHEPEKNFYIQPTKNKEKMHCYCPDCKMTIFSSTSKLLGLLEFIEHWQKKGSGIAIKSHKEKGFLPIGGQIKCPSCKNCQTTMLKKSTKKGYFQLSCHWEKCHFQVFVPYGYLYIFENSENKK